MMQAAYRVFLGSKKYTPAFFNCQQQVNRWNSSAAAEKLYEFRVYKIRPCNVKKTMELAAQCLPIRFGHSPCLGYWLADLGGLNEAVHIWEYASYNERADIRKALNTDTDWIEKAKPMISNFEEMNCCTMRAFPWSDIKKDVPAGGVYFFYNFLFKPATSHAVMSDSLQTFINSSKCDALGVWYEELGKSSLLNGYALFNAPHYDSEKNPAKLPCKEWQILREVTTSVHGRLLQPQPWSAMQ